jgi:ATP-dependent Clp protease ATP-binding subunit ClpA
VLCVTAAYAFAAGCFSKEGYNKMEKCIVCNVRTATKDSICNECVARVPWLLKRLRTKTEMLEKALENNENLETAKSHEQTASDCVQKSDFSKALELYKRALAIREKLQEKDHADIVALYKNIAEIYDKQTQPQTLQSPESAKPIYIDKALLFKQLERRIIGQNQQLETIAAMIRTHVAKTRSQKPLCLLFAGNTGCGKTQTALVLSEILGFRLIRIDCNCLSASHKAEAFITGSPPGFRDSGTFGILEPLTTNPNCLLLFDECEKAHVQLFDVLMNAMDTGIIQLSTAIKSGNISVKALDCRKSIFVFSSNLTLDPTAQKVGFIKDDGDIISDEERYKSALAKHTRPEIAGRMSACIKFSDLSDDDIKKIIRLEISQFAEDFGLSINEINGTIVDEIAAATSAKFGARAHVQFIEKLLGELFCDYLDSDADCAAIDISGSPDAPQIIARSDIDDSYDYDDEYPF